MEKIEEITTTGDEIKTKDRKKIRRAVFLSRVKRKLLAKHLWLVRAGIGVGVGVVVLALILLVGKILDVSGTGRYLRLARMFLIPPQGIVREIDGRTNILILGKAGEGYTAPDLTDTMILASVDMKGEEGAVLVSLPRDIWLDDLRAKLNSVYYWGNKKKEGGGLVLAKSTVEEIVGIPVHYGVVVDFEGFTDLIDMVDGVEVEVERSFEDRMFPIPGREDDECGGDPEYRCRYETIRFEKGLQTMDGTMALKYVRSRHSEDEVEGTDFARSRRQQNVLNALKKKLTSRGVLLSPGKLSRLWERARQMIETDLTEEELAVLARRAFQAKEDVKSVVVPEELLVNPPLSPKYDSLYVFIPRTGNWEEIHGWVEKELPRD